MTNHDEHTTHSWESMIAAGPRDPVTEAGFWLISARQLETAAASRLGEARAADADRTREIVAIVHAAAEWFARAARAEPSSRETGPNSGNTDQADTDLDDAWRQAATITHTERLIAYGNDGPYEIDRSLPAEDRERRDAAIAHISERTGVPTWYLTAEILEAVNDYLQGDGAEDEPHYSAPPDWGRFTQEYNEDDIAQATDWHHQINTDVHADYGADSDHDHHGDIAGDSHEELMNPNRHDIFIPHGDPGYSVRDTRAAADRETEPWFFQRAGEHLRDAPKDATDESPVEEAGEPDVVPGKTTAADAVTQAHAAGTTRTTESSAAQHAKATTIYNEILDGYGPADHASAWKIAHAVAGVTSAISGVLPADTHHAGTDTAEAIAGAHAAVAASERTTNHDPVASTSDSAPGPTSSDAMGAER